MNFNTIEKTIFSVVGILIVVSLIFGSVSSVFGSFVPLSSYSNGSQEFVDDFSSYSLGNDTERPVWVPQYVVNKTKVINISGNFAVEINSTAQISGDRDLHIQLNSSNVSNTVRYIIANFQFNSTSCNQTWKNVTGVTQQVATAYLFYNNTAGSDFLDAEFKANSNDTFCDGGTSQLSMFKRTDNSSTALIPFTTYTFTQGKNYNVSIKLERVNASSYNYSVSLDGTTLASSTNVTTNDLKNGAFLLENAGTVSNFDNVNITSIVYTDVSGASLSTGLIAILFIVGATTFILLALYVSKSILR